MPRHADRFGIRSRSVGPRHRSYNNVRPCRRTGSGRPVNPAAAGDPGGFCAVRPAPRHPADQFREAVRRWRLPEFDVWIRLLTDLDFTAQERAAVLLDALPPGLFATLTMPVAIPTIEFTAHFTPEHLGRSPNAVTVVSPTPRDCLGDGHSLC
ncbi:hypothetical protein ACETU7_33950 [Rhodococcus sp. 3Y1]